MPVLVTGASGFVGSHVVMELLSRGFKVRVMMRDLSLQKMFKENKNLQFVKGDLFDVDSLKRAVDGCEDVIHCAAALNVGAKNKQKEVVDPSVIGVENLCSVMTAVKRIIHTSSVAAIRSTEYKNGQIFTNDDWCDDATIKTNPYGLAKAEGERKMRAWANGRDVRLVTIHPSVVFGPILHPRHCEGSMSYLKHFVSGPPFILDLNINFVDVRDVAIAHVNALEMGDNGGRHIIHSSSLSMKEIGMVLKGKSPKRLPRFLVYILAIFHPKLSWRQLKDSLGTKVVYDIGQSYSILQINSVDKNQTLLDGYDSIKAQS
jgi:dihydroflavonol-4-reductase